MTPIILGQTMSLPRLLMNCLGGPQHPLGAQPKLYKWGRSQKKGKCFSVKNLIQSELSSKEKVKKNLILRKSFKKKSSYKSSVIGNHNTQLL